MICNSAPYDVRHELAISQAISRDFAFHTIDGKFRSAEVNDFLRNVLTDAERRMSSKQLL